MLKTEENGKRKSTRTIILEKIDEKSPFISKMKKHLYNYKFYGSETAVPRVVELEDQEELPMDPSDVPMNTNEQVPRGLNNNEPDLRDKLTRKVTKRLLENPEVDAREIIEVKTAKKQRVVETSTDVAAIPRLYEYFSTSRPDHLPTYRTHKNQKPVPELIKYYDVY